MSNDFFKHAEQVDNYVGLTGDISTLLEKGADGSDGVDKAIASLSLASSLVGLAGSRNSDLEAFAKGYGFSTDILLTELALRQMFKNIGESDAKGAISNFFSATSGATKILGNMVSKDEGNWGRKSLAGVGLVASSASNIIESDSAKLATSKLTDVIEKTVNTTNQIAKQISDTATKLNDAINNAKTTAKDNFEKAVQKAGETYQNAQQKTQEIYKNAEQAITNGAKNAEQVANEALEQAKQLIKDFTKKVSDTFRKVSDDLADAFDKFKEAVQDTFDKWREQVSDFFDKFDFPDIYITTSPISSKTG